MCRGAFIKMHNTKNILETEKGSRCRRTTKIQLKMMVDYVNDNKIILSGKLNPSDLKIVAKKWKELADLLNTAGQGPQKTVVQWKKAFQEFRTNTRKRAREILVAKQKTGGGTLNVKQLTELELKLLGLISKVSVEGAPVYEAGINMDQNISQQERNKEFDVLDVPVDYMQNISQPEPEILMDQPPPKPVSVPTRNPKRKRFTNNQTSLEQAINKHVQCSENMNKSLDTLSDAIKMLASSMEKLASSIGKMPQI